MILTTKFGKYLNVKCAIYVEEKRTYTFVFPSTLFTCTMRILPWMESWPGSRACIYCLLYCGCPPHTEIMLYLYKSNICQRLHMIYCKQMVPGQLPIFSKKTPSKLCLILINYLCEFSVVYNWRKNSIWSLPNSIARKVVIITIYLFDNEPPLFYNRNDNQIYRLY